VISKEADVQVTDLKILEKLWMTGLDEFQMEHGCPNPLLVDGARLTQTKINRLMSVWGTDFIDSI